MFEDRSEAGRRLAERLAGRQLENPVVLALPRGGVPVGFEIAQALGAPLDLVLVRKIGAPFQEELAVGAVAEGDPPEIVRAPGILAELGLGDDFIDAAAERQLEEIARRRALYIGERARADIEGRTAIVVDDGIATGATMRAALRAVRRRNPAKLILAVPVAPEETLVELRGEVDEAICLSVPARLYAVGIHYRDFRQVDDADVIDLLQRAPAKAPLRADAVPPPGAATAR
jgi:putative phosphoribosyl transferase